MTKEEKKEQVIQSLADMLRTAPFQLEIKVKKKPVGIKIIIEVTREEMDAYQNRLPKKTVS